MKTMPNNSLEPAPIGPVSSAFVVDITVQYFLLPTFWHTLMFTSLADLSPHGSSAGKKELIYGKTNRNLPS